MALQGVAPESSLLGAPASRRAGLLCLSNLRFKKFMNARYKSSYAKATGDRRDSEPAAQSHRLAVYIVASKTRTWTLVPSKVNMYLDKKEKNAGKKEMRRRPLN